LPQFGSKVSLKTDGGREFNVDDVRGTSLVNPAIAEARAGLRQIETVQKTTQSFVWTEDDEESLRVLKLGGALGIFMLLGYVAYDFHVRGSDAPGSGFHWMVLGGTCLFFGLVWTTAFKRYWKFWVLFFCTFLMTMFVLISAFTREPESRFIAITLAPLVTAAFVTWGTGWQFAMGASAMLIFEMATRLVPIDGPYWSYRLMGLIASVVFAQYTSIFVNRYRQRLRKQVHDLEDAARFRQSQIATMAHDIRSPVAALSGYVNLLDEDGIGPKERTDLLARIGSTAWNMDLVVSNVLDFYQVQENDVIPAPVELDPNLLLLEVSDDCAVQARRRRLKLRTDFAQLPECRLDPRHFERIVRNLLAYAISRTVSGEVVLRTAVRSRWIVIDVTDNGPSLSPDDLKNLFQRPNRNGSTTTARTLGLYIARVMAESVGGRVEARYVGGRGITLIAELPLEAEQPTVEA
jgi:signal transduction histidine kinase